jgi:hypothetical protein
MQNSTIRTRKEEERCLVVRQARKASGVRLFLRHNDDGGGNNGNDGGGSSSSNNNNNNNGTMPTLMGIRPPLPSTNQTTAATGEEEAQEVCMIHFQGPGSKKLIFPFELFLEGGSGNAGKEDGDGEREEFVLP